MASEVAREVIWMKMLVEEIGFKLPNPVDVYEDNAAAKNMTDTVAITDRNKHIRTKWHYVRQCVQDGTMKFRKISSKENPADGLTKAVNRDTMEVLYRAAEMTN